jgi:hypothetical protein
MEYLYMKQSNMSDITSNESTELTTEQLMELYLESLSEMEYKAYLIAKDHLQSTFQLEKSNGFLEFVAARKSE